MTSEIQIIKDKDRVIGYLYATDDEDKPVFKFDELIGRAEREKKAGEINKMMRELNIWVEFR